MSKGKSRISHCMKNKELFFLGLLILMIAVVTVIVAIQLHSTGDSQIMAPVYQNHNHGLRTS